MSAFAAVTTGRGTGAISTIQVFGDDVENILQKIFKTTSNKSAVFKPGKILFGTICRDSRPIDQVTIGCEEPHSFAINCHGNPLLVADIMQLLQQHGTILITVEKLLAKILSEKQLNTITLEAQLTLPKAMTIEGTKIIANQIDTGLSRTATQWLQNINSTPLDQIKVHAKQILEKSRLAKLIIFGCKACLIGPPNTGKSTLLNFLSGRQKAIVSDIKGTTRDWVSAHCKFGCLAVELIDTAGLGQKPVSELDKASQLGSLQILQQADLILLVLDNSQPALQLNDDLLGKITGRKILTVLNKADLPVRFDTAKLPQTIRSTVQISAKLGTGIENLTKKIPEMLDVVGFDLKQPVCITNRQQNLLKQLTTVESSSQAVPLITELLNGRLCV